LGDGCSMHGKPRAALAAARRSAPASPPATASTSRPAGAWDPETHAVHAQVEIWCCGR
jgi:hypothetical protein